MPWARPNIFSKLALNHFVQNKMFKFFERHNDNGTRTETSLVQMRIWVIVVTLSQWLSLLTFGHITIFMVRNIPPAGCLFFIFNWFVLRQYYEICVAIRIIFPPEIFIWHSTQTICVTHFGVPKVCYYFCSKVGDRI